MEEIITPKTINDIKVEINDKDEKIAVLYDAKLVEDIKLVYNYAIDNNIKLYHAVKNDGDITKNYILDENEYPIVVADDVLGVNPKYVEPVVEETKEDIEVVDLDKAEETSTELSLEEIEERKKEYEKLVTENIELKDIISTKDTQIEEYKATIENQKNEIAELKDRVDSLEMTTCEVSTIPTLDIDTVINFLKEKGITSISVKGE